MIKLIGDRVVKIKFKTRFPVNLFMQKLLMHASLLKDFVVQILMPLKFQRRLLCRSEIKCSHIGIIDQ